MKLDFPATQRNAEPIWSVLEPLMGPQGTALEIASGSGQHLARFAGRRPHWIFIPSDIQSEHRDSIRCWCSNLPNVREPLSLDVCGEWSLSEPLDGVWAINLIHIAPWEATLGLMRGCQRWLREGGFLYLYGAYKRFGMHTAPSNEEFDRSLRGQDARWGVRDLEEVVDLASLHGMVLDQLVAMPANNYSVVFRKVGLNPADASP